MTNLMNAIQSYISIELAYICVSGPNMCHPPFLLRTERAPTFETQGEERNIRLVASC